MLAAMTLGQLIKSTERQRPSRIKLPEYYTPKPEHFLDGPEPIDEELESIAKSDEPIVNTRLCYAALREQEYQTKHGRPKVTNYLYHCVAEALKTGQPVAYELEAGEDIAYVMKRCHQVADRNYDKVRTKLAKNIVWIQRRTA